MELTGLKFEVAPGFFNEDSMPLNLPPKKYVREMAVRKAQGVAVKYSDALVIGANLTADIRAARKIGVEKIIWVPSPWKLYSEGGIPESILITDVVGNVPDLLIKELDKR